MFQVVDINGKPSKNNDDTFLKCKYNSEIYRYNEDTLALYLTSTNTANNVIPKLKEAGVKLTLHIEGDTEYIYLFPEKDIDKVAAIMKPQIKGKNIQAKSKKTARLLAKAEKSKN